MAARGKARFTPTTVKTLRDTYLQTCAICLKSLTGQGSECAHLFPAEPGGERQVAYYVELGLLDSTYRRDGKENGVNNDVFESVVKGPYANLYCLVTLPALHDNILPGARSEILIRRPPRSVLKGAKWLQNVVPQPGDATAFIMNVKDTALTKDWTEKSISLTSPTDGDYLWRLPISLKVVLAVLIQVSISIMSLSPGEEIILAQEIHLLLRRSVPSVTRIMNAADTSGMPGSGVEKNNVTPSFSGSSPPPPLIFGTAAPVSLKHFKFKFQYVLEPDQASEVEATRHTLPIQGYFRSWNEIRYTAEGAVLACGSMLPTLVAQLATLKVGSLMLKARVEKLHHKPLVTRIALRGPTGAGKSSLINALLGAKLVPTSGTFACTATPIEISYHEKATIEADIHFVSREEWLEELQQLCDDIRDFSDAVQKRVEIAWNKVHAVYPAFKSREEVKTATVTEIMESDPDISKRLGLSISVVSDGPIQFAGEIRKYVAEMNHSHSEPRLWPLIKRVDIRYKSPVLENGVVLIDLPGDADTNAARNSVSQRYNKECEYLWIVTPAIRAVNDATAKSILDENLTLDLAMGKSTISCLHDVNQPRFQQMEGKRRHVIFDAITLIASKCDDISWKEIMEEQHLEPDTQLAAIQSDMDRTVAKIEQLDKLLAADGGVEQYRELQTLKNQLKRFEQDHRAVSARKRSEFVQQQLGANITRELVGVQVFTCSSRDFVSQETNPAADTDVSQIPLLRDLCKRLAEASAERKAQSLMQETWNFAKTVHNYAMDTRPSSEEARATLGASWDSRIGGDIDSISQEDVYSRLRNEFSRQGLQRRLVRTLRDVQETAMGRASEQLDLLSLDEQSQRAIKRARETAGDTVHQFFKDMHTSTLKATLRRGGAWGGDDLNMELLNPFKKRIALLWAKFCDFDTLDELEALALATIHQTLSDVEESASTEILEPVAEQVSFCMSEARVSLSELLASIRHNVKHIRGKLGVEITAHVKAQLQPAYLEALSKSGPGSKERQIISLCDYVDENGDKIFGGLSQILTSWIEKMEVSLATLWEDADDNGNSEQVEARKAVSETAKQILKQLDLWKEASAKKRVADPAV
ncbi:hypothetical protein B0H16DRAFT_1743356 [Mycena metata]|uniref:Dynamin N-terminal domain-containing protein n=1 Tax=Mycena metata TaxID=1033252 RepID=A0AAD7MEF0_9AGAR|nr:hypothetical protein B0H16DRAFT_1743356 [Mycena metata]